MLLINGRVCVCVELLLHTVLVSDIGLYFTLEHYFFGGGGWGGGGGGLVVQMGVYL